MCCHGNATTHNHAQCLSRWVTQWLIHIHIQCAYFYHVCLLYCICDLVRIGLFLWVWCLIVCVSWLSPIQLIDWIVCMCVQVCVGGGVFSSDHLLLSNSASFFCLSCFPFISYVISRNDCGSLRFHFKIHAESCIAKHGQPKQKEVTKSVTCIEAAKALGCVSKEILDVQPAHR